MTDNTFPRFFMQPVQDDAASQREGRPIFNDIEMVEVMIPGDRNTRPVFHVEDKHRERWPKHYEAFKRQAAVATTGMPIDMWPQVTASRAMELKAVNILTVESLADLPDGMLSNLGAGSRDLREKAKAFIAAAAGSAAVSEQAAEIARLRDMVEALTRQKAAPAPAPREISIEDASDDDLKAFIKARTGQAPRGNVSRETLEQRAADLAEQEAA